MNKNILLRSDLNDFQSRVDDLSLKSFLEACTGFIRRHYFLILTTTTAIFLAALVYCVLAPPKYTAEALLILEDHTPDQFVDQHKQPFDSGKQDVYIDSQVEVLKSEELLQNVAKKQKLYDEPEFNQTGSFLKGFLSKLPGSSNIDDVVLTNETKRAQTVDYLKRNFAIDRVGLSLVIRLAFTSRDRQMSSDTANSLAEAYIDDQLSTRTEVSEHTLTWMQTKLDDLLARTNAAENNLQAYKTAKGIVDTSKGLIDEQKITELNTQISTAKQKTFEAQAKQKRVEEILLDPSRIGSMPNEVQNDVLSKLREENAALTKEYEDLRLKLGSGHAAVLKVKSEREHLGQTIQAELSRVSESIAGELQIANASLASLEDQMKDLQTSWTATNIDLVKMRELETVAKSYHALYQNLYERFLGATQQQSFPNTAVRVITFATPPSDSSEPKIRFILPAAALLGALLGVLIALLREGTDSVFRTTAAIENELGLKCFGILPLVRMPVFGGRRAPQAKIISKVDGTPIGIVGLPHTVPYVARMVQLQPTSHYAETLRSVSVELGIARDTSRATVLGITSSLAEEGKSSLTMNLALISVQAGRRTLVIDCDLRNPTFSRWLDLKTEQGLFHILTGQGTLTDVLHTSPAPSFDVIPAGIAMAVANTNDLLSANALPKLLESLRGSYDLILLDLPPVVPVHDVQAVATLVDKFIYLVAWGKTPVKLVKQAFGNNPQILSRVLGVILSGAKQKEIQRYEGIGSYSNYYGT
jgi:polysaccharide biosynthesis transport protein